MCIYIYMYVYAPIFRTFMCICTCISRYMNTHDMHTYWYVCMHAHVYICVYKFVQIRTLYLSIPFPVCVCTYMYMYMHMYMYVYIYVYIHIYIYMYIHTHIHRLISLSSCPGPEHPGGLLASIEPSRRPRGAGPPGDPWVSHR